MPNWATNTIVVHGKPPILKAFKAYVSNPDWISPGDKDIRDNTIFAFNNVVPIGDTELPHGPWGTKWDACYPELTETEDTLIYTFDTAWDIPRPIIRAVQDHHTDKPITILWAGSGEAYSADDSRPEYFLVADNINMKDELVRTYFPESLMNHNLLRTIEELTNTFIDKEPTTEWDDDLTVGSNVDEATNQ